MKKDIVELMTIGRKKCVLCGAKLSKPIVVMKKRVAHVTQEHFCKSANGGKL